MRLKTIILFSLCVRNILSASNDSASNDSASIVNSLYYHNDLTRLISFDSMIAHKDNKTASLSGRFSLSINPILDIDKIRTELGFSCFYNTGDENSINIMSDLTVSFKNNPIYLIINGITKKDSQILNDDDVLNMIIIGYNGNKKILFGFINLVDYSWVIKDFNLFSLTSRKVFKIADNLNFVIFTGGSGLGIGVSVNYKETNKAELNVLKFINI